MSICLAKITMKTQRQAVLVFANASALDCQRRRWPRAFGRLFETQDLADFQRSDCDVHVFTRPGSHHFQSPCGAQHRQVGSSFAQKLQNAVETLARLGYEKIVIVGSDCPDLNAGDVEQAFRLLQGKRLALGPDHRGGCYLIGLHVQERDCLKNICWQRNTDFEELVSRVGAENVGCLSVKIDLDDFEDLRSLARSQSSFRFEAALLLKSLSRVPEESWYQSKSLAGKQRIFWQLPPPLAHNVLL